MLFFRMAILIYIQIFNFSFPHIFTIVFNISFYFLLKSVQTYPIIVLTYVSLMASDAENVT